MKNYLKHSFMLQCNDFSQLNQGSIWVHQERLKYIYILENYTFLENFINLIVNLIFNPITEFKSHFELFNIMVNQNFSPFIESLIYPFLHTLAEVTYKLGFTFLFLSIFQPSNSQEIYITSIFWMVNHKNSPIMQFFSSFIKDNKYMF